MHRSHSQDMVMMPSNTATPLHNWFDDNWFPNSNCDASSLSAHEGWYWGLSHQLICWFLSALAFLFLFFTH